MEIDPKGLSPRHAYRLLISCVVPRPIAWLSTCSSKGIPNLAPFSFFGGITSLPPTVMVSIGRRRGERKDSSRNLLETGEGVVHIVHRPLAEAMVQCSAEVPSEVDEFDLAGLDRVPARHVAASRLSDAAIAMEVQVSQHLQVGKAPMDVFLLEILLYHVRDELLRDGLPDPARMAAVGRLGGDGYCDTSDVFEIPRP